MGGKAIFSTLHKLRIHPFVTMQRTFKLSLERLSKLTRRDEYLTGELSSAPKPPIIRWEANHISATSKAIVRMHEFRMYLGRCVWVCRSTDLFDQVNGEVFKTDLIAAQNELNKSYKQFIQQYNAVQDLCNKAYFPEYRRLEREREAQKKRHVDTAVDGKEVAV